jgi:hypothetical protein
MTSFGSTFNIYKPYLDLTMGQFHIDELDLTTPLAPEPDRVLDGVKYWNHVGFHNYNRAVVQSTLPIIEKRLEDNGLKSAYPYPPYPAMPPATLTFEGDRYYNIEAMMGFTKEIIRRCLDHAIGQPLKQGKGKNMDYQVPCGVNQVMDDKGYWKHPDIKCKAGDLCPACKEVVRLRNIIDQITTVQLTPEEIAKARLMAVVRDITAVVVPTQDPKYTIIGGKICNAATGVAIPDDEPVMIFRAKDKQALAVLEFYRNSYPYNDSHDLAIRQQIRRFSDFACDHSERMKNPDT